MNDIYRSIRIKYRLGSLVSTRSFTLVELLVLIAIMCILAALLLPGLHRAFRHSRQIACAKNQSQMHTAAMLYTNDNSGWMPAGYLHIMINELQPYINYPPDAYSSGYGRWYTAKGPYFCPETEPFGQDPLFSGSYSGEGSPTSYSTFVGTTDSGSWFLTAGRHKRLHALTPGCAILTDAHLVQIMWNMLITDRLYTQHTKLLFNSIYAPDWRHGYAAANFLFIDGHVSLYEYTGKYILNLDGVPIPNQ